MDNLVTLLAAVVGAILGYWGQPLQAKRTLFQQWAERAAESMADVMGLLMESKPTNLEESDDPDAWLAGVLARCASVERSVDVLGVGYPEAQIRQQARELSGWFFHAPGTFDDSSIW